MAYGRRKKGGQRLMEISRAGAKRKAARKAKTLAQAKANIAKGPVTRGGAKKKVAPAKAAPTKAAAKKLSRTPAQKDARMQSLRNLMSEARSMGNLSRGLTKDIGDAQKATKAAITVASLPVGGAVLAPLKAAKGAKLAKGAKEITSTASKAAKPAGRTAKPSVQTPRKPSGPGSKTPKKSTGPGSRTTRKQTATNKAADRTAKRKERKERKERVAGGRKRVGQAKRRAGAARGRRTQRRQATLRGGGTVTMRNRTGSAGYR